jgi:hypothetical protein
MEKHDKIENSNYPRQAAAGGADLLAVPAADGMQQ